MGKRILGGMDGDMMRVEFFSEIIVRNSPGGFQ